MHNIIYTNERSILTKVKEICTHTLKEDDFAIDMTIGNGFDTLFLSNIVTKGIVFGFDIQQDAIDNTNNLLKENNKNNYQLFLESHENINKTLASYQNKIKLILFNLGYLPKGNKKIMTNHTTTLNALKSSLKMVREDGIILMVFYPHEEGKKEAEIIKSYLKNNNINYTEYHNTNNENAPFLIEIHKLH